MKKRLIDAMKWTGTYLLAGTCLIFLGPLSLAVVIGEWLWGKLRRAS